VGGVVVEVFDPRDDAEGVAVDVLVLRTPDLLTRFVNNCIQVRVSVSSLEARGFGEEVGEEGEVEGGRRLYGGGGDGGRVAERWGWAPNNVFGRWGAGWEDGGDGRRDVLDFFDEWDIFDEAVEIGSVGGDVGEKIQRLVLKVVELVTSDGEEGAKEEAGGWGGDVVVEEGRRRGRYLLEVSVDGGGGCVDVGLVGETYFRPSGRGDGGGDGGVGVGGVVESKFGPTGGDVDGGGGGGDRDVEDVFVELCNEVGGGGDGTKVEGHLVWLNSQLQY